MTGVPSTVPSTGQCLPVLKWRSEACAERRPSWAVRETSVESGWSCTGGGSRNKGPCSQGVSLVWEGRRRKRETWAQLSFPSDVEQWKDGEVMSSKVEKG